MQSIVSNHRCAFKKTINWVASLPLAMTG